MHWNWFNQFGMPCDMNRGYKSKKNEIEKKFILFFFSLLFSLSACTSDKLALEPVTYGQFESFVNETGYITDAEKYGWSIVQRDVFTFDRVDKANWKFPDGVNAPMSQDLPITQVSYNDALAYCKWSGKQIPSYDQYWELVKEDNRKVVSNNNAPISSVSEVNVLGNVWDIVAPENNDSIRLAGGSLYCSPNTCHGTVKERELYVDKETSNIHIGFCVISD